MNKQSDFLFIEVSHFTLRNFEGINLYISFFIKICIRFFYCSKTFSIVHLNNLSRLYQLMWLKRTCFISYQPISIMHSIFKMCSKFLRQCLQSLLQKPSWRQTTFTNPKQTDDKISQLWERRDTRKLQGTKCHQERFNILWTAAICLTG